MGRIGLDGRNLGLARGTGVATYGAVLARTLPLLGLQAEVLVDEPRQTRARRWLAAASPLAAGSKPAGPDEAGFEVRRSPDVFRTAQVHFDVWGRLLRLRGARPPRAMHWTYPLPLRFVGVPNLYTIHDLIPLTHSALTGIDPRRMRRMLGRIAAAADHIVTVSEASRQEIVALLGIDPARVTNTWQAVDVGDAATALPHSAGLVPGGYWLHVGAVERRRNLPRLIAAWREGGAALPLVLAGPDGWQAQEALEAALPFLSEVADAGRPCIIRLPWLARPALLALIRDARALLMPSLAEGFGLPVIEAMALGTPVLTSRGGALEEVAGGAALLVDAQDGAQIAAGLRSLEADPALRGRLTEAGLRRAVPFGRDAYAARLDGLYRGVRRVHQAGGTTRPGPGEAAA